MSNLNEMVFTIRRLQEAGLLTTSLMARARAAAQHIPLADIHDAIRDGEAETAREKDRVKFVTDKLVVFVAVSYEEASDPGAVIVSAFALRK